MDTWRFSVCADSESNIAGYQFGVDIEDFTVTSVSNGSAYANVLSENGQTFSLAFSFTGGYYRSRKQFRISSF